MTATAPFDDELFEHVLAAARPGDVITTLGIARPNWITSVDRDGLRVEMERSKEKGSGFLLPRLLLTAVLRRR